MNDEQAIPYGFCQCGCGQPTNLAPATSTRHGWVKGEPVRFRHGHWARIRPQRPTANLFWEKVKLAGPDECWEWQAFRNTQGYGQFWDRNNRRMVNAHRWAYETVNGPLAEKPHGTMGANGELVCHSCDNPPCVNPAHLFVGTQQDNMDDKVAKGRQADHHGERNPKAKLTAAEIAQIRASFTGRYGEKMAIARRWGISSGHVSKILAGDVWSDA